MESTKTWIEEYVQKKPGVELEYKAEWEAWLLRVAGKMFGMHGENKEGRPILTLKLAPERGDFLRRQHEYMIPGYYMNKTHYNSILLDMDVPEDTLRAYMDESYALVYAALTAKARREIEEQ